MSKRTADGYLWEEEGGVIKGLDTDAFVSPQRATVGSPGKVYDVVVIGAGYAGLCAARDLSALRKLRSLTLAFQYQLAYYLQVRTTDHSVLLLEARDRIGGRTYTASKDGELLLMLFHSSFLLSKLWIGFFYEMGGTWVTHHMGYLFREMVRYGMDRDLIVTGSPDMHKGYYTINVQGAEPRTVSHEEAGKMQAKAWDTFVNVDGQYGRTLCPLPHAMLNNRIVERQTVEQWDQLSCHDRFEQIKHELTAEEQGLLISLLLHISGGNMKNSGLWDMIRSHALLMYSSDNFADVWLRYKLRDGQTELARRMFADAVDRGLEYSLTTPIRSIVQGLSNDQPVILTSHDGQTFRAEKVITTIPLNVLKDIEFVPSLSKLRQEAIQLGHVNKMTKVHADVSNPELERWNGMIYPGNLMYGYGDGKIPNGNVHIVAFGADEGANFIPEKEPEKALAALKSLHPMNVKRMVGLTHPESLCLRANLQADKANL